MSAAKDLVSLYLDEEGLSFSDFVSWYLDEIAPPEDARNPESPRPAPIIPEGEVHPKDDSGVGRIALHRRLDQMKELREELGLAVINHVRDQVAGLLEASQECYSSPVKTPRPPKYDYESPAKKVRPTGKDGKSLPCADVAMHRGAASKTKKKVQLFSDTETKTPEVRPASCSREERRQVEEEGRGTSIMRLKYDDSKLNKLEERFNSIGGDLKATNQRSSQKRKGNTCRRSLDSMLDSRQDQRQPNSQYQKRSSPHQQQHSSRITTVNLGDLITLAENSGKQNKKGKKKKASLSPASDRHVPGQIEEASLISLSKEVDDGKKKEDRDDTKGVDYRTPEKKEKIPVANETLWHEIAKSVEKSKEAHQLNLMGPNERPGGLEETTLKSLELPLTPAKASSLANHGSKIALVKADPAKVTEKKSLDKLVELYSLCLQRNLIVNVAAEVHLLMEMLCAQQTEPKGDTEEHQQEEAITSSNANLLATVHNCAYFAVRVLEANDHLLGCLDTDALQFLRANSRIAEFSPSLEELLNERVESSSSIQRLTGHGGEDEEELESVRYQSENDSVENFPSERAFQDFKKQRDTFYQILRRWKEEEAESRKRIVGEKFKGKKMNRAVTDKSVFKAAISSLIKIQEHPVNMSHLARLVRDQLLITCTAEIFRPSSSPSSSTSLWKADPLKLTSLEKRLGGGEEDDPDKTKWNSPWERKNTKFPGTQEFFMDALVSCNHFIFLSHMEIALIKIIREKEKESFDVEGHVVSDVEDGGRRPVSPNTRSNLSQTIISLQLAAKFLGLVESLKFTCPSQWNMSEAVLVEQIRLRELVPLLPLNLERLVLSSLQRKRLLLTLPWVVEFCSILDTVSLRSKPVQRLLKLLADIYKSTLRLLNPVPYKISPLNSLLLNLLLGDLFENPLVPRDLFFNYSKCDGQIIQNFNQGQNLKGTSPRGLDEAEVLTPDVVVASFNNQMSTPYLSEASRVLIQFVSDRKTSTADIAGATVEAARQRLRPQPKQPSERKRIVPLVEERDRDVEDDGDDDLLDDETSDSRVKTYEEQVILERNFFRNQAGSVRKFIESLSERAASNATIDFADKFLPDYYRQAVAPKIAQIVTSQSRSKNREKSLDSLVDESYRQLHSLGRPFIRRKVIKLLGDNASCISSLLPSGMKPISVNTCLEVAKRHAVVQGYTWMRDTITYRFLRQKLVKMHGSERRRVSASVSQDPGAFDEDRDVTNDQEEKLVEGPSRHDSDYEEVSPSQVAIDLSSLLKLSDTPRVKSITPADVVEMVGAVKKCFDDPGPYEVSAEMLKGLESLTFDLAFHLICNNPSSMTSDAQDALLDFWTHTAMACNVSVIRERSNVLLSEKNVTILSSCSSASWTRLEHFICRLVKSKLFRSEDLEQQCLAITRKEWPKATLSRLASCLQAVVDCWKKMNLRPGDADTEFAELAEWLVWYFGNVDTEFDSEFPSLI